MTDCHKTKRCLSEDVSLWKGTLFCIIDIVLLFKFENFFEF